MPFCSNAKKYFSKEYLALVYGKLSEEFDTIDLPIARKMIVLLKDVLILSVVKICD